MPALYLYLLEGSCCLIAFFVFYHFLLRQETSFHANRFFILVSSCFALLIPLLHIEWEIQNLPIAFDLETYLNATPSSSSTMFVTQVSHQSSLTFNLWTCFLVVYLAGVLFSFSKLLKSFYAIWNLYRRGEKSIRDGYCEITVDHSIPVFSFFNNVFLYKKETVSENGWIYILKHEKAHIQQGHSYDILLMEILKIIFWFHPCVYFFKNHLQEVHEYLADQAVLKQNIAVYDYASVLVNQARNHIGEINVVNHFHNNQIKNRLLMMNKTKSPMSAMLRLLAGLPLMIGLFFCFAVEKSNAQKPFASSFIYKIWDWNEQNNFNFDTNGTKRTKQEVQKLLVKELKIQAPTELRLVTESEMEDLDNNRGVWSFEMNEIQKVDQRKVTMIWGNQQLKNRVSNKIIQADRFTNLNVKVNQQLLPIKEGILLVKADAKMDPKNAKSFFINDGALSPNALNYIRSLKINALLSFSSLRFEQAAKPFEISGTYNVSIVK